MSAMITPINVAVDGDSVAATTYLNYALRHDSAIYAVSVCLFGGIQVPPKTKTNPEIFPVPPVPNFILAEVLTQSSTLKQLPTFGLELQFTYCGLKKTAKNRV